MKELKAKPKVTQAMTRDGLTLENQATGEVENISSREAEQDYTPEAGGTAEKLLERALHIVCTVTGCSREEARLSLARNRGSARKAVEEWEAAHGK